MHYEQNIEGHNDQWRSHIGDNGPITYWVIAPPWPRHHSPSIVEQAGASCIALLLALTYVHINSTTKMITFTRCLASALPWMGATSLGNNKTSISKHQQKFVHTHWHWLHIAVSKVTFLMLCHHNWVTLWFAYHSKLRSQIIKFQEFSSLWSLGYITVVPFFLNYMFMFSVFSVFKNINLD